MTATAQRDITSPLIAVHAGPAPVDPHVVAVTWPDLLFREGEPQAMSTGTPAGGHHDVPVYGPRDLPTSGWTWWRRRKAIRMVQIGGPCRVVTAHGTVALPRGWRGYLVVDEPGGFPYPIGDGDQRRTYEPAGEPS